MYPELIAQYIRGISELRRKLSCLHNLRSAV
jgi:hypothetical protein